MVYNTHVFTIASHPLSNCKQWIKRKYRHCKSCDQLVPQASTLYLLANKLFSQNLVGLHSCPLANPRLGSSGSSTPGLVRQPLQRPSHTDRCWTCVPCNSPESSPKEKHHKTVLGETIPNAYWPLSWPLFCQAGGHCASDVRGSKSLPK